MKKFLFISYSLFLLSITIFTYLFIDPNVVYFNKVYSGFYYNERFLTTFIYTSAIFIFFCFYFLFLLLLKKKKINKDNIKRLILLTTIFLFFSYPAMVSYDIFNYIATSKVLYFYHENPYLVMPIEFTGDPLLSFMHAANKYALYGHFWILLSAIPYIIGLGNFLLTLFLFKLFTALFYLLTVLLIWRISKNLISVTLFALNPLVIIESLVSGHNDIVMIFFALYAIYSIINKKIWQGIIFLLLSILIKYATIFLIPVFVYLILNIYRNKKIDQISIFYYSALSMLGVFLLSPLREEIYPWYATWFLTFVFLCPQKKLLFYISIALSFGLLFRYTPFMLTGTYFDLTPLFKRIFIFLPPFIVFAYWLIKFKIQKINK